MRLSFVIIYNFKILQLTVNFVFTDNKLESSKNWTFFLYVIYIILLRQDKRSSFYFLKTYDGHEDFTQFVYSLFIIEIII